MCVLEGSLSDYQIVPFWSPQFCHSLILINHENHSSMFSHTVILRATCYIQSSNAIGCIDLCSCKEKICISLYGVLQLMRYVLFYNPLINFHIKTNLQHGVFNHCPPTILTSFLRKLPPVEKEKLIVSAWRRTLRTKCTSQFHVSAIHLSCFSVSKLSVRKLCISRSELDFCLLKHVTEFQIHKVQLVNHLGHGFVWHMFNLRFMRLNQ